MIRAVLGGTFEYLHAGHIKLLSTAFNIADEIVIGVTSDKMASQLRKRAVRPFNERVAELRKMLESLSKGKKYTIVEINDPYGPSIVIRELDIIIVSTETFEGALKINEVRRSRGLEPLAIAVINLVETDAGYKISSTLIHNKKVDEWGRQPR